MLDTVNSILKSYHQDHGIDSTEEFPIKTRFLQPYIEERGVVDKIDLYEADVDPEYVLAQVQKFRGQSAAYSGVLDYAKIYYAKSLNVCWRRFGVCKEMYHCMIDRSDGDRVTSVDELQNLIELLATDTTAITGDFKPFTREQEAIYLALETLFPVEFRQDYIENAPNDPATYYDLAKQFRIPVEYSIFACQPNYVKAITQQRGRLLELS